MHFKQRLFTPAPASTDPSAFPNAEVVKKDAVHIQSPLCSTPGGLRFRLFLALAFRWHNNHITGDLKNFRLSLD